MPPPVDYTTKPCNPEGATIGGFLSLPYDLLLEVLTYLKEEDVSSLLRTYSLPQDKIWQDLISRKHRIRLREATGLDYILLGSGLRSSLEGNSSILPVKEIITKFLRDEEEASRETHAYWTTTLKNPLHYDVRGIFFTAKTPSGAILRINKFRGDEIFRLLERDASFLYILKSKISSLIQGIKERLIRGELEEVDDLLITPDPLFPTWSKTTGS